MTILELIECIINKIIKILNKTLNSSTKALNLLTDSLKRNKYMKIRQIIRKNKKRDCIIKKKIKHIFKKRKTMSKMKIYFYD